MTPRKAAAKKTTALGGFVNPSPEEAPYYEEFSKKILADPATWAEKLFYEPLGWKLWTHPDPTKITQRDLIEAPFKYQFSAWPSGHSMAKSESTGLIIATWLMAKRPRQRGASGSFVLVLSASWPNITNVIFPNLRSKIGVIDPEGEEFPPVLSDKWMLGDKWGAVGISPDVDEVGQGYHSEGGTLIIVDEASSLRASLFESLLSLVKSKNDAMIFLGNTIRAEGIFADISRGEKKYKRFKVGRLSSRDSPNYVATEAAIARGDTAP